MNELVEEPEDDVRAAVQEAMTGGNLNPKLVEAGRADERKRLKHFDVYDEIEDDGRDCIDTRWVDVFKDDPPPGFVRSRIARALRSFAFRIRL